MDVLRSNSEKEKNLKEVFDEIVNNVSVLINYLNTLDQYINQDSDIETIRQDLKINLVILLDLQELLDIVINILLNNFSELEVNGFKSESLTQLSDITNQMVNFVETEKINTATYQSFKFTKQVLLFQILGSQIKNDPSKYKDLRNEFLDKFLNLKQNTN